MDLFFYATGPVGPARDKDMLNHDPQTNSAKGINGKVEKLKAAKPTLTIQRLKVRIPNPSLSKRCTPRENHNRIFKPILRRRGMQKAVPFERCQQTHFSRWTRLGETHRHKHTNAQTHNTQDTPPHKTHKIRNTHRTHHTLHTNHNTNTHTQRCTSASP